MVSLLFLLVLLFTCAIHGLATPNQCVMYGECTEKTWLSKPKNCKVDQPPVILDVDHDEEAVHTLDKTCGKEFASFAFTTGVCCDKNQITSLSEQLALARSFVSSCPACMENLQKFFCHFACSPIQSSFVNVTQYSISPLNSSRLVVESVDFYVNPLFAAGFFSSCKQVKFGAANEYAMTFIGGGAKNYSDMLNFMGQKKPSGSPFDIQFPWDIPDTIIPLDITAQSCADSHSKWKCSCLDCEAQCPVLKDPIVTDTCTIRHYTCSGILFLVGYCLCVVILLWAYLDIHRHDSHDYMPIIQHNVSTLESFPASTRPESERKSSHLHAVIQKWFYKQGLVCAKHPRWVVECFIGWVLVTALGWLVWFDVEVEPVKLWVSPYADAALEKDYFDEQFGPFYRTEQMIVTSMDPHATLLNETTLLTLFDIEHDISSLSVVIGNETLTLSHFCLKPIQEECVVTSVTGFWQGDKERFQAMLEKDSWKSYMNGCLDHAVNCLPKHMQPLKKNLILGGPAQEPTAFIVTWVVQNTLEPDAKLKVEEWEKLFIEYMQSIQPHLAELGLGLSFTTEVSVKLEINQETRSNAVTILLSYLAMFAYISLSLGTLSHWRRLFLDSKWSLGLYGILIVLSSVSVSFGLLSALGIKTTMIIAEVIPFLVLAIGVDNIFIIVGAFERIERNLAQVASSIGDDVTIPEKCAMALAEIGPSLLLSTLTEVVAFGMGCWVDMPAVSVFSLYAALAVFMSSVMQVTVFISLLCLDAQKRSHSIEPFPLETRKGYLETGFQDYLAPFLLHPTTRKVVVSLFGLVFAVSLFLAQQVEYGLDQRLAFPRHSYLVDYFNDLDNHLDVGPPVYFVTRNVNVTDKAIQPKVCGRFSVCESNSLMVILEQERRRSHVSFIAEPASSWLDDFILWLDPSLSMCCRVKNRSSEVDPNFCLPSDPESQCQPCMKSENWKNDLEAWPQGKNFTRYLQHFLSMTPNEECPLAGKAAYKDAIHIDTRTMFINATSFRTFHRPLKSQNDYIQAYMQAKRISKDISSFTGLDVFAYSVFYVYFAQYATLFQLTTFVVVSACLAIFFISWGLLNSIRSATLILCIVVMILVDLLAVMSLWDISLNAVSTVNLSIAVGIAVEFLSHLTRAYMVNRGTRPERVQKALVEIGTSIFSGITLTKFVGVSVLSFATSRIFQVYYFRMYLSIILLSALHGLVLLPVLLSWLGDVHILTGFHHLDATSQDEEEEEETYIYS